MLTVVIIMILAMITINFLFGENGLVTRTQEAAKQSNIERVREQLEMATGTAIADGKGTTTIDDYFDILVDEGIIGNKDSDTVDNKDGTYDIITNDGFVFEATPVPDKDNAEDILLEYVGDATGPRIRNITATTTTHSTTIEVEAVNAQNGVFAYEYKKNNETEWQTVEGATGSICTIEGLEENEIYNIRVTITVSRGDNAGTATRETSIITKEMPTGAITFEQAIWQGDGTASVVVHSSQEGYTIQYQIVVTGSVTDPEELEEANWKPVANGGQITGIQHNQTVYARLWDGHNGNSYANADIKDTEVPKVSVTVEGENTSNSVTVSVQATDNESGMIESPTYTYSIKQTSEPDSSYKTPSGASNITANSYTFTGLTQGTSYDVKVEVNGDKAGNTGTGYLPNQTTGSITGGDEAIQTGAITFGNTTWSNNLASITVSTNTNYTIQYQVNGTADDGWETIANGGTIGNLSYPSMVYARLYDGTNYGSYASAGIIDNTNPQNATINLSSTNVTTETNVTATVTHNDAESGPEITQCKYVWNTINTKIGLDPDSYTGGTFSGNGHQISMNMTSPATYYLHVLTVDKAENKWETVSSGITVRQLATGITVNPTSTTIYTGQTIQLTATITPNNTSNQGVSWTSDNSGIASVNGNGLVTAVSAGTTTIRATTADGSSRQSTCTITVIQLATGISVSPTSVSIVEGGTSQLTATIIPNNTSNQGVSWTSDNSNIARVNGNGLVTAVSSGTTTIRATTVDGSNRTATCQITVTADQNRVENKLKAGDYVYYYDATNTRRTCVVLYNNSLGVEIITREVIDTALVAIGDNEDLTTAINSYNNAISALNSKASEYNNSNFSDRARCVGSNPNNPSSEAGTSNYFGYAIRNKDDNYLTDYNKMVELGIVFTEKHYWLASRDTISVMGVSTFAVRSINILGDLTYNQVCYTNPNGNVTFNPAQVSSVRPVFHLKSNIKVIGGSGTMSNPYTLGT